MPSQFESDVISSLSRLEAQMESLVGNGQPGRISLLEGRVQTLELSDAKNSGRKSVWTAIGAATLSIIGLVFHWIKH